MKSKDLMFSLLGNLLITLFYRSMAEPPAWLESSVTTSYGHYPHIYCTVRGVVFDPITANFVYGGEEGMVDECGEVATIWPFANSSNLKGYNCDKTYDTGHAFTFFYWVGTSNYYHITLDTMIPLFEQLYYKENSRPIEDPSRVLLMPTVESSRLQALTWQHDAFTRGNKYWVDMIKLLAGGGRTSFEPLDESFLNKKKTLCFDKVYFGTPNVSFRDKEFIQAFIQFVRSELDISDKEPEEERMALISRKGRRKILNEEEVVESLKDLIPVDLLELTQMTFKEQVEAMQKYTVFAALNGAGLMNALYLPWYATAIQMVPYKAGLNVKQYGELIQNRGPTTEWHNTFENLTREHPGDTYRNRPDTIVHLEDFKKSVKHALELARETKLKKKQEL